MDKIFEMMHFNREVFGDTIKNFNPEQLNKIPEGFNNSLIWNIAHVLVTEQLLCYALSGLPMHIDEAFVNRFRKGTRPEREVTPEELKSIQSWFSLYEQTKTDYHKGRFHVYSEYATSTGIKLENIEDALQFNAFHEGIHLGVILSLKKLV